ncbi:hypothetical protein H311_05300, partial [Anncaliia algerae PRA109]
MEILQTYKYLFYLNLMKRFSSLIITFLMVTNSSRNKYSEHKGPNY